MPVRVAPVCGGGRGRRRRLSLADQCQRQVRQRREIARGADGSLRGNHGQDVGIEQGEEGVDDERAHAGETSRQVVRLEQQHAPYERGRERFAHAARMAAHEVELQLPGLLRGNDAVGERAEARVDAVRGPPGFDRRDDGGLGLPHACAGRSRQLDHRPLAFEPPQLFERERGAVDGEPGVTHAGCDSACGAVRPLRRRGAS